jgi:hypothetical protein
MLERAGTSPEERPAQPFHPRTKCCTYVPVLPNFVVGRVLAEPDPKLVLARDTVIARIDGGAAVTPLSLGRPPAFADRYAAEPGAFGRDPKLRCPHYIDREGGLCGIWAHRPAVCATWFCRHERRALGRALWVAMQGLLSELQAALAIWAAGELGLGDPVRRHLLPTGRGGRISEPLPWSEDRTLGERARERLWGVWTGRERAWFRATGELVSALSWEAACAIGGDVVGARLAELRRAEAALARDPSALRLVRGPLREVTRFADRVRVVTYSTQDPLVLSASDFDALDRFDGRPATGVLAEVAADRALPDGGAWLGGGLLAALVDARVLVPAVG